MITWQSIENAPKDGTSVLVTDGIEAAVVTWERGYDYTGWFMYRDVDEGAQYFYKPTHYSLINFPEVK
jgi:hypothetical protein